MTMNDYMNHKSVEILGGTPGVPGALLSRVYDETTGTYWGPAIPKQAEHDAEYERLFSLANPGRRMEDLAVRIAVIDTGVMRNHPLIAPYLVESVDFTGEGPEDFNGHGTIVSLLAIQDSPIVKLMNVKAIDADGRGSPELLIKAIDWSAANGARIINISAGVYHKKWGLFECEGDCKVCQAAERASKQHDSLVLAAAGNEHGKTYCPAKVGLLHVGSGVLAVAAVDAEGLPLPNSGRGNVAMLGQIQFRPISRSR
jgi:hypothetical protein